MRGISTCLMLSSMGLATVAHHAYCKGEWLYALTFLALNQTSIQTHAPVDLEDNGAIRRVIVWVDRAISRSVGVAILVHHTQIPHTAWSFVIYVGMVYASLVYFGLLYGRERRHLGWHLTVHFTGCFASHVHLMCLANNNAPLKLR